MIKASVSIELGTVVVMHLRSNFQRRKKQCRSSVSLEMRMQMYVEIEAQ